jgi:uncharacterized protein YhaN
MRLSTLELLAFGHFSGETLRFADGTGAINVVYGDNEAGKSTSLRAVGSFFFGIPVRTTDDFLHQKPTLRIGAEVISAAGQSVRLVRRKGAKGTLRDSSDNPLDEDTLARMLGGLDRELFEQMFALSRDTLVAGGNDLLSGSGSVGEALFGASLGLAGINDILHALEDEAAALFKPGGSVPALNASLRELEGLRREVRELELRPADFLAHQAAFDSARAQRESLDGEMRRVQAELTRLERNKRLLPLARLRAEVKTEEDSLGSVVVLAPTAREERLAALRDRERADADIDIAQQRIETLTAQLDVLQPNDSLLARSGEIAELHQDIGAIRKAARDRPGLRTQHRGAVEQATALLAQTHPERSIDEVDDLRLTLALRNSITSLREDFVRIDEATRNADARLAETRQKLKRARRAQRSLPPAEDTSPLVGVLTAARRLGDVDSAISEAEAEHRAANKQLLADLAGLASFAGSIDDLERLPVPAVATAARFETAYRDLADQSKELDEAEKRTETTLASARERLKALELAGVVPAETDLTSARSRRDHGWGLVRTTLEGAAVDTSDFAGDEPLPDAFEASLAEADDVADRLRREADRVAARADLEATVESCQVELSGLQAQRHELSAERETLDAEWAVTWQPSGIEPLPPSEMGEWLETRAELVSEIASQRQARGQIDGKIAIATRHRSALARELAALGLNIAGGLTVSELIALTEDVVETRRQNDVATAKARELIAALEDDEETDLAAAERAARERAIWSTEWAAAVTKIGLEPTLSPDQVREIVDALAGTFAKLDLAAGFRDRVEKIERDSRNFAAAAAALAAEVAPTLASLEPEQAVLELHRLLNTSQTEAAQAGEVGKQVTEASDALRQAEGRKKVAEAELLRLVKAAKCPSVEALEAAEDQSSQVLALRDRLRAVDEQMTQIGAAPPATLATEVVGLELDQLDTHIHERTLLLAELEDERRGLDETVGEERALLAEMSRGEGATEATAAVESAKATVRERAEQYARLRLAIAVLRQEIDRFREESHGPLLVRASYFFAKLTCARYSGFTTGFDDHGNVILLGRRANGAEITVEQMSEGTRDQLYLALRLATIEQQVQRSEPLPLIIDDLFVNFDDQRAAAGFEVLAEIAQRTQVIFFTHHRHLVEIAETTLKPDQWALRELGREDPASRIQAA